MILLDKVPQKEFRQDMHRADIGIDHLQFPVKVGFVKGAEQSKTRIVDDNINPLILESFVKVKAGLALG